MLFSPLFNLNTGCHCMQSVSQSSFEEGNRPEFNMQLPGHVIFSEDLVFIHLSWSLSNFWNISCYIWMTLSLKQTHIHRVPTTFWLLHFQSYFKTLNKQTMRIRVFTLFETVQLALINTISHSFGFRSPSGWATLLIDEARYTDRQLD